MNDERYLKIHAYLSGVASDLDKAEMQQWLEQSPENEKLFDEMQRAWELAAHYPNRHFDAREALDKMPFGDKSSNPAIDKRGSIRRIYRVAAAAVVLVLIAAWGLYSTLNSSWNEFSGSKTEYVTLEDGSKVHLNDDGILAAPVEFGVSEREVRLVSGEAFFDVEPNAQLPFRVETRHLDIVVLGTSFNVSLSDDHSTTRVCVVEGKVKLIPEGTDQFIDLVAGECGELINEQKQLILQKLPHPDMNDLAWHTGKLEFRNAPVSEIVAAVERTFDVQIDVSQCNILDCPLTIPFRDINASKILDEIAFVFNADLKESSPTEFTLAGGDKNCGR